MCVHISVGAHECVLVCSREMQMYSSWASSPKIPEHHISPIQSKACLRTMISQLVLSCLIHSLPILTFPPFRESWLLEVSVSYLLEDMVISLSSDFKHVMSVFLLLNLPSLHSRQCRRANPEWLTRANSSAQRMILGYSIKLEVTSQLEGRVQGLRSLWSWNLWSRVLKWSCRNLPATDALWNLHQTCMPVKCVWIQNETSPGTCHDCGMH